MKKIKHIIWDWNGTILDDAYLCNSVINDMLSRRKLPSITIEEYSSLLDFPIRKFYTALGLDCLSQSSFEGIANEYVQNYENRKFECSIRKEIPLLLEELKKYNVSMSILSACANNYLRSAVNYYGVEKYFDNICGLNDNFAESKVNNGKKLIKKIGIPKQYCLYIGDTVHDKETADAIEVSCWLFPSGHNSRDRLHKVKGKVFNNLGEIKTKLFSLIYPQGY